MIRIIIAIAISTLLWCGAQAQFAIGSFGSRAGFSTSKASGGGSSFSLTYESTNTSTAATATISFGTMSYGSGASVVYVGICYLSAPTAVTVSSVSVNGVSGSAVSGVSAHNTTAQMNSDIWFVVAPGGSSGTVSVTWSGAITSNSGFPSAIVSLYNVVTTTTTPATSPAGTQTNNGSTLNRTPTIPSGGAAIAQLCDQDGKALAAGWANATADHDSATTSGIRQFVANNTVNAGSAPVITVTIVPNDAMAMSVAAVSP